jgi:xanthine dehydrogenase large subunit
MSDIARTLGLDPLDVRRRNFYDREPGARATTHYGQTVDHNVGPALVDRLEQTCDYRARREEIRAWNATAPRFTRGIALVPEKFGISFTATFLNQAGAVVDVYTDGTVLVSHGGTEMGQGLHTKVAQIVATALGVPMDRVRVVASDTAIVPNASATAASSGTDLNGQAAWRAATTIRTRLARLVAERDGCAEDRVVFADGRVTTSVSSVDFADVVRAAHQARVQLWSDGFYATPDIGYDPVTMTGRPFYYFSHGAACAEVELDTWTGEHRVLAVDVLFDAGRSVNPAIDIGQVEGGFVQGTGWLTTEEVRWDESGALLTRGASTYKIPTAHDVPERFTVALWPEPNPEETIGRSKAVGEPPLVLAISVFEALREAVGAVTPDDRTPVRLDPPASPERLLAAIRARGR